MPTTYTTPIPKTPAQIYSMLKVLIGKKHARYLAYKASGWRKTLSSSSRQELQMVLRNSTKLKDIRLLQLFNCRLNHEQQYIFFNNGQRYVFQRND